MIHAYWSSELFPFIVYPSSYEAGVRATLIMWEKSGLFVPSSLDLGVSFL